MDPGRMTTTGKAGGDLAKRHEHHSGESQHHGARAHDGWQRGAQRLADTGVSTQWIETPWKQHTL